MRCQVNQSLRCWIQKPKVRDKYCPLNSGFQRILEKAVLTGRELKSTDIKKFIESVPGTNNIGDYVMVSKANVAICFQDWDSVCILMGLIHRSKAEQRVTIKTMNIPLCHDLIKGGSIFVDRLNGFGKRQSEKFADRLIREIRTNDRFTYTEKNAVKH